MNIEYYKVRVNIKLDLMVLGNNKEVDNLFGIIVEEPDSTISFLETYVYSATTPYTGGESIEIFSGVTAQTFNQTTGFTQECCETINKLLTDKGVTGLGLEKDYIWNSTVSACTWNAIDDCAGDCAYSGPLEVISREDCLSGITTGNTINGWGSVFTLETGTTYYSACDYISNKLTVLSMSEGVKNRKKTLIKGV